MAIWSRPSWSRMTMVRLTDSRRARNSDSVIEWRLRPSRRPSLRRCFFASRRVEPLRAFTWSVRSPPASASSEERGRRRRRLRPPSPSASWASCSWGSAAESSFFARLRRLGAGASPSSCGPVPSPSADGASAEDLLRVRRFLGGAPAAPSSSGTPLASAPAPSSGAVRLGRLLRGEASLGSSPASALRREGASSGPPAPAGSWKTGAWKSRDAAGATGAGESSSGVTVLQLWAVPRARTRPSSIARWGRKPSGPRTRHGRRRACAPRRHSLWGHAHNAHPQPLSHRSQALPARPSERAGRRAGAPGAEAAPPPRVPSARTRAENSMSERTGPA